MLNIRTLITAVTIAAASVNGFAAERQTNPLHPSYYAERVTIDFPVRTMERYADAGNPLHPAFTKTAFRAEWMVTAKGDGKPHMDSRNPLHPFFRR